MKKSLLTISLLALSVLGLAGCGGSGNSGTNANDTGAKEIAVVTDVGQLMDGGFNQGTYEGAEAYAKAHSKTYQYYQPANGAEATDGDRVAAMELAVTNGAKVIVAPGFLQENAMRESANKHPDVKYIFIDGYTIMKKKLAGDATDEQKAAAAKDTDYTTALPNVTAVSYKEQEAGYMAGYAAVMDGYTKLGGTFGGGGSNPACDRFAYGYAQGIDAAAKASNKNVDLKISFRYGDGFGASAELQSQISGWYATGTEVVFSCGGSMVQSVISAADANDGAKIIGVDTDQHKLSDRVITSATKGLAASVQKVLGQFYDGQWDSVLGGKAQQLGAADDATGLPTSDDAWRFRTFTKDQYNTLYASIKNGNVTPKDDIDNDCNTKTFWSRVDTALANTTITLD